MFSGLREAVLSGVKYELIKIRKPVSLSRVNSTSFHSIPATSENRNNKTIQEVQTGASIM